MKLRAVEPAARVGLLERPDHDEEQPVLEPGGGLGEHPAPEVAQRRGQRRERDGGEQHLDRDAGSAGETFGHAGTLLHAACVGNPPPMRVRNK
jgi:hypothetical protein